MNLSALQEARPRRFIVNTVSIFAGETFARLATSVMALVIARRFGPVALGEYGYAVAIGSVLLVIPDLGLHLFAMRELAANPQQLRRIFWGVHWLKIALAVLVIVFTLFFGAWGIADDGRRVFFYILASRGLLQTFSQATMAVFKAFERTQFVAAQQLASSVIALAWAAAALWLDAGPAVVVSGLAAGQAAEMLLGWRILGARFAPGSPLKPDRKALIAILAGAVPIGFTALLAALNLRVDILVLSLYVPDHALGQFQAAAWFLIATFLMASLAMAVVFPKLSRLLERRSLRGRVYVFSLLKNSLLATAAGSVAVWAAAPVVVRLLFGDDLAPAAGILRILAPALPLVFTNTVLFYVFLAARRRAVCAGALTTGVAVGAVLCFALAPRYGAAGCAVADVVRELVTSGVYLCFLVKENYLRLPARALLKAVTPSVREWRLLMDDRI